MTLLFVCLAIVPLSAQDRSSTPAAAPVPTVVQPAEGAVVSGDLVIAVQVPAGVAARKYTTEAAYWNPARNAWEYPGTMGDEFGGGVNATTRIAADVRVKYNSAANRWRIHVRAVDPPGSWGPWREFTWQPGSSPTAAPAPAQAAAASAGPANAAVSSSSPIAPRPDKASQIAAGYDKEIAAAKGEIARLDARITAAQEQIAALLADKKKALALMQEALTSGASPAQIAALKQRLGADDGAISEAERRIDLWKAQINQLDELILKLQKQKVEALKALKG